MVKSDHSDNESRILKASSLRNKRSREECSDDEACNVVLKKEKLGSDEGLLSFKNATTPEICNVNENEKETIDADRISQNGIAKPNKEEENNDGKSIDNKNEQSSFSDNNLRNSKHHAKSDSAVVKETEDKDAISSIKSVSTADVTHVIEKNENDNAMNSKKKQSGCEDSEVVDGLELSVECASEKTSSSESDFDKTEEFRGKTVIIKAHPNDSELDISSSDVEKSADNLRIDVKKGGKQLKGVSEKPFDKLKSSGTENTSDENSSSEDYGPQTRKKVKRLSVNKKLPQKTQKQKNGHGHSTKDTAEPNYEGDEREGSEHNDKKNSAVETHKVVSENKKKEDVGKSTNGDNSISEDENEHEKSKKGGKRDKRSSVKPEDDKRIQSLKKYIRAAGITVKSYQELWAECKSNAARVKCLQKFLEKNGISGRPTLEKCKKLKDRLERQKELVELDTKNIISEGRITRARRNKDGRKKAESSETPDEYEAHNTIKRIRNVIDSDSE